MKIVITFLLTILMTTPVSASTANCHDLVMSYVLANQDRPKEPGDLLYTSENNDLCPMLLDTTAYMGECGSHGDTLTDEHVAYMQHAYGWEIELYHANIQEDGTYALGDYIGRFQVRDTGYGKQSGTGESAVRPDKSSMGTIENGKTVDVHRDSYKACKAWMKETQGMVFALFIKDVKG